MRELKLTPYGLAKAVKGKMTAQTVYNFVKGKSEISAKSLGHLMDALGLEIREKD